MMLIVMPRKVSHKEGTKQSFYEGSDKYKIAGSLTTLWPSCYMALITMCYSTTFLSHPIGCDAIFLMGREWEDVVGEADQQGGTTRHKQQQKPAFSGHVAGFSTITGWEEHISHISVLEVVVIWWQACQMRSFQSTNSKRLQYQQIFPRKKPTFCKVGADMSGYLGPSAAF